MVDSCSNHILTHSCMGKGPCIHKQLPLRVHATLQQIQGTVAGTCNHNADNVIACNTCCKEIY